MLHAGLYYPAGTLKARLARDGNRAMAAWCEARGLPLRRCGKLVVAQSAADHPQMDELVRRAAGNDVPLELIDDVDARRIEPAAATVERALFAPETCSVDPRAIVRAMGEEAGERGIHLVLGAAFTGRGPSNSVQTTAGEFDGGYLVNAAGLYADRIARAHGFGERYRILPFRGLYLKGSRTARKLACHVYPVPDLELPFLGVHFTVTVDDGVKIGPTALPALWREQYGGLQGFSLSELAEIGTLGATQLLADSRFRALARQELAKSLRGPLLRAATRLVPSLDRAAWTRWGPPGIRAQLLDRQTRQLVLDFRVEGDDRSFHVLNAISPGFTCSLPFARYCCDEIERLRA